MIELVVGLFLWIVVVALFCVLWRKDSKQAATAARDGCREWLEMLPRLAIGVIGSGFLAALLPEELVRTWLGESSGLSGLLIAMGAGALVPGGPVVGFAIGATALKSGAAVGPVTAFVTSWALFGMQRVLVWELPFVPRHLVLIRLISSLPLPLFAAYAVIFFSA